MGTKEEISEMFDALERDSSSNLTDPPSTEAPVDGPKDEPKTEPPTTEQPTKDEDGTQTKPPSTEPPTDDELSKIKKENEDLRKKLEESITKKDQPPKTSPPSTDAPIGEEDFLGNEDPEDIARDPVKYNKMLNTIYKKAVEFARSEIKKGKEETYRNIPTVVETSITTKENLRKLSEKFYTDNSDLKGFPKVVSTVFVELVEKDPSKTYEEVLKDVGTEVRSRLGLQNPEPKPSANPKDDPKPPPLPRKKGGKQPQSNLEPGPLASEIDAMNKVLKL